MNALEKSLIAIEKYFDETSNQEILQKVNEIDSLQGDGVSFFDYLNTLNDSYKDVFTNSTYWDWESERITQWPNSKEENIKRKLTVLMEEVDIIKKSNINFTSKDFSDLITCNSSNLKLAA